MAELSIFDDPSLVAPPQVERIDRPDLGPGAFVLRSPVAIQPCARCVGDWLERWANETPGALAFAEPDGGGWAELTWAGTRQRVGAVAQALLDLALPEGKPVVVLSDNSLDHVVLMLAAMHVGRPVCTVSSAYSRLAAASGGEFSRLQGILAALKPALVYASDAAGYGAAAQAGVAALASPVPLVFSHGAEGIPGAVAFAQLAATPETPAVTRHFARLTPDNHAKYLLTSGSTGTPKVVINTHRMLCANQQMIRQTLRFLEREKPVLLDWLPWSHTFGGNHNLNQVLANGGTLYIDDGRPMPGLVDKTIAHLRQVQPSVYYNVPRGFDMLLPVLEADAEFAQHFFGSLRMLFYAGAGMPQATWQRLEAVAAKVRRAPGFGPLWMTTSWGSTETAPANTFANWRLDEPGVIGLPMPGVSLKFIPNGGKLEMRVKGEHIFPGYRHDEAATRAAFDNEGYYCIGDAGRLRDPADPLQGVVFDGRVAEDFKLTSGTWVSVGTLRLKLVTALAPLVQDAVLTGHDRAELGALLFLSAAGQAMTGEARVAAIRRGLAALRAQGGGSSQTPSRVLLLADGPNAAAGEITDKGYVNQRLVLARRAADVEALYEADHDPRVVS